MTQRIWVIPLLSAILTFTLAFPIFRLIDSPGPYLGGLLAAFFAFEISFFYQFNKKMIIRIYCKQKVTSDEGDFFCTLMYASLFKTPAPYFRNVGDC
jgi:hypothetical protein